MFGNLVDVAGLNKPLRYLPRLWEGPEWKYVLQQVLKFLMPPTVICAGTISAISF